MAIKRIHRLAYVTGQSAVTHAGSTYLSSYSYQLVKHPSIFFPEVTLALTLVEGVVDRDDSRLVALSNVANGEVLSLPNSKKRLTRWLLQWPAIWECIREADVVCVTMPTESGFLAAMASRLARKPLLVQVIGDWREAVLYAGRSSPPVRTFKSWIAEWMTRLTLRAARLIFTQGQVLFEKCAAINPVATRSDIVHTTLAEGTFARREKGGFHDPVRILSVCRLAPGKGLNILASAIRSLREKGLRLEWWCVGEGPAANTLKELTESLGISDCVRFFGHVLHGRDLFELYRQSDMFVLPSFHEGIPNVILEAMANSMPVVSTDVGSIRQVIAHGVEGVLLPAGEPQLLADAIYRVVSNYEMAHEMGRAAYERAKRYKPDVFSGQHRRLIESAFGPISLPEPVDVGQRMPESAGAFSREYAVQTPESTD